MPEPEMIERVQRAIVEALRPRGEVRLLSSIDRFRGVYELNGDFDLRAVARAAIEAMRQPTQEMVKAAARHDGKHAEVEAAATWEIMAEAALAEPTA